jgi:hypothetical protein
VAWGGVGRRLMRGSACEAADGLCEACAACPARARAYLDLGRELGMEASA